MSKQTGIFVISLDFELYWGMRDVISHKAYRQNLLGVRSAIEQMLALFRQYDIHATWATVGFLMFEERQALCENLPEIRPAYTNKAFDLYNYLMTTPDMEKETHFAPDIVQQIVDTPHQELATHTFSHYYCLEEGQDKESFAEDIRYAVDTMHKRFRCKPTSIVFPRNQYNRAYMPVLAQSGIVVFRGNEKHPLYDAVNWDARGVLRRMVKLLDTYWNISGYHTYVPQTLERVEGVLDVPASRFLRPFNPKLAWLDRWKQKRIEDAMTYAAKHGEMFHLWWHPHNFGRYTAENMRFLEKILRHYRKLHREYGMQSYTMAEVYEHATGSKATASVPR